MTGPRLERSRRDSSPGAHLAACSASGHRCCRRAAAMTTTMPPRVAPAGRHHRHHPPSPGTPGAHGAGRKRAIADGLQPEKGPLRIVQLPRLRQPRRGRRLRGQVRRQGRDHHLRHRHRGDHRSSPPARSRSTSTTRWRPTRINRLIAGGLCSRSTSRTSPTSPTCSTVVQRPVVRPGRDVLGALHCSRPASATAPTGSTRPRSRPPGGTCSGTRPYKGVISILDDYREAFAMAMLRKRHSPTSTPPTRRSSTRPAADLGELTDL